MAVCSDSKFETCIPGPRCGLRVSIGMVVVVLIAVLIGVYTLLLVGDGFVSITSLSRSLEREARNAAPLVDAIYAYRYDNEQWPKALSDLAPKYINERAAAGWKYFCLEEEGLAQLQLQGRMHTKLTYVFAF